MKKFYTLSLFIMFYVCAHSQTIIAKWDFDNLNPALAMIATTGNGTFTTIGGVEAALTSSLMPAGNPAEGKAYSIKTFPEASANSGTAGFEFKLSTVGITDPISVTFDSRASNTGSKWQQYEYTTDGTNWNVLSNNGGNLTTSFTATPMISLTFPAACNDKLNFGFRIVSIFAPGTSSYAPVNAVSTYGISGTWRIDNVTFSSGSLAVKRNSIAGLHVYPNPVKNGNLFITSNSNVAKAVAVYDILGKQVLNAKTASNVVNVSTLKGGTYIVKITEDGKSDTRKLIIE